jgi:hypothetical protein
VCPTCYRTQLAGGPLLRVATIRRTTDTFLFLSHTTNAPLFKFHCNIFIGVRIIKEMVGLVASGTHCISYINSSAVRCYNSSSKYYLQMDIWYTCAYFCNNIYFTHTQWSTEMSWTILKSVRACTDAEVIGYLRRRGILPAKTKVLHVHCLKMCCFPGTVYTFAPTQKYYYL